jgi:hypothetical protein
VQQATLRLQHLLCYRNGPLRQTPRSETHYNFGIAVPISGELQIGTFLEAYLAYANL